MANPQSSMIVVRVVPDAVEISSAFPSLPLPRLANFNMDFDYLSCSFSKDKILSAVCEDSGWPSLFSTATWLTAPAPLTET